MATLATTLADVTTVFSSAIGWVGTVASTIAGEPLLLIPCVLGLGGIAIGYFKRMAR